MRKNSTLSLIKTASCCLLTICIQLVASNPLPKLRKCQIGSDIYSVGSTFHPVIRADGDYYTAVCTRCTCTGTFIPLCDKILCPVPSCENPVRPNGQCCATCGDEEEGGSANPNQCIFNGFLIGHGQTFHPALLQPSQSEDPSNPYCTSCICSNSHIECKNHSLECPALNCQGSSVLPEGICCPICPTPPVTTLAPSTPPKPDCRDIDGRTFFNGDQWHPAYPPHGLITCINCTCVDSRSVCVRLPCPEGPLPPCAPDEPVDDLVLCCPKCTPVSYASTSSEAAKVDTTTATSVDATISPVVITTCLKGYSIKVWQHRVSNALAMEDIERSDGGSAVLTIWRWQSVNGTYSHTTTVESVHTGSIAANYDLVGWTKPARVQRLTTNSKKQKIDKCQSSCYELLLRLLRVRKDCDGER